MFSAVISRGTPKKVNNRGRTNFRQRPVCMEIRGAIVTPRFAEKI